MTFHPPPLALRARTLLALFTAAVATGCGGGGGGSSLPAGAPPSAAPTGGATPPASLAAITPKPGIATAPPVTWTPNPNETPEILPSTTPYPAPSPVYSPLPSTDPVFSGSPAPSDFARLAAFIGNAEPTPPAIIVAGTIASFTAHGIVVTQQPVVAVDTSAGAPAWSAQTPLIGSFGAPLAVAISSGTDVEIPGGLPQLRTGAAVLVAGTADAGAVDALVIGRWSPLASPAARTRIPSAQRAGLRTSDVADAQAIPGAALPQSDAKTVLFAMDANLGFPPLYEPGLNDVVHHFYQCWDLADRLPSRISSRDAGALSAVSPQRQYVEVHGLAPRSGSARSRHGADVVVEQVVRHSRLRRHQ